MDEGVFDLRSADAATAKGKISIRWISKSYELGADQIKALESFDLDIDEGEFVCILGPSGCGKTTLLRMLAGLETPSEGEIVVRRQTQDRPLTSMIFQEASVFPWMRVRDNVAFGLRIRGVPRQRKQASVEHFLDLCRLLDEPTPAEAEPSGKTYCFDAGVEKTTGEGGFADVWKMGRL